MHRPKKFIVFWTWKWLFWISRHVWIWLTSIYCECTSDTRCRLKRFMHNIFMEIKWFQWICQWICKIHQAIVRSVHFVGSILYAIVWSTQCLKIIKKNISMSSAQSHYYLYIGWIIAYTIARFFVTFGFFFLSKNLLIRKSMMVSWHNRLCNWPLWVVYHTHKIFSIALLLTKNRFFFVVAIIFSISGMKMNQHLACYHKLFSNYCRYIDGCLIKLQENTRNLSS